MLGTTVMLRPLLLKVHGIFVSFFHSVCKGVLPIHIVSFQKICIPPLRLIIWLVLPFPWDFQFSFTLSLFRNVAIEITHPWGFLKTFLVVWIRIFFEPKHCTYWFKQPLYNFFCCRQGKKLQENRLIQGQEKVSWHFYEVIKFEFLA